MQCCGVLYYTTLYKIITYYAILCDHIIYFIILHYTASLCIILCYITLCYITLCYNILSNVCYITVVFIMLYDAILHYTPFNAINDIIYTGPYILYYITPWYAILYSIAWHVYYTMLDYNLLHSIIVCQTMLCYAMVYYMINVLYNTML